MSELDNILEKISKIAKDSFDLYNDLINNKKIEKSFKDLKEELDKNIKQYIELSKKLKIEDFEIFRKIVKKLKSYIFNFCWGKCGQLRLAEKFRLEYKEFKSKNNAEDLARWAIEKTKNYLKIKNKYLYTPQMIIDTKDLKKRYKEIEIRLLEYGSDDSDYSTDEDLIDENLYDIINSKNLTYNQLKEIIKKVFNLMNDSFDLLIYKENEKINKIKLIFDRWTIDELKPRNILEINEFILNNDITNITNNTNNTNINVDENYFEKLPNEIIFEIAKNLNLSDVVKFCRTCKRFQNMLIELCDEDKLIEKTKKFVVLSNDKNILREYFHSYNNIIRLGIKVLEKTSKLKERITERDNLIKEKFDFLFKVIKFRYEKLDENKRNKIANKIYNKFSYYIFDYDEINKKKYKYDYYFRKILIEAGKIDLARFVIDEIRRILNLSKNHYVKK
ncbi:MAG: F-box protein [Candidatus Dojkabacteria bacterium]|nr:F-box protein [Candidatus Dojkabacteria bacterium]